MKINFCLINNEKKGYIKLKSANDESKDISLILNHINCTLKKSASLCLIWLMTETCGVCHLEKEVQMKISDEPKKEKITNK